MSKHQKLLFSKLAKLMNRHQKIQFANMLLTIHLDKPWKNFNDELFFQILGVRQVNLTAEMITYFTNEWLEKNIK